MTVATPRAAGISARHPLAPLTVAEAGTAAKLALAATGDGARLGYVTLAEPEEADVLGWDGTPPPIMMEEFTATGDRIRDDRAFQAALARRGITDMSRVQVDTWPASNF